MSKGKCPLPKKFRVSLSTNFSQPFIQETMPVISAGSHFACSPGFDEDDKKINSTFRKILEECTVRRRHKKTLRSEASSAALHFLSGVGASRKHY